MKLLYGIKDRPKFGQVIVFALQQLLAILAATIAVPSIVGNGMSQSAALLGAGAGTIVYLLFTKFRSPVFLGSSFAFIGSMSAAFAGAVSVEAGYVGLIIGAAFAAFVYIIIAIVVKFAGVRWINFLMPPVVIGPTVAVIGLSLAGNAVSDSLAGAFNVDAEAYVMTPHIWLCLICALVTFFVVIICSVFGKKMVKLIPFIIGIVAGYIVAMIFTLIGNASGNEALKIIDFSAFSNMKWIPEFTFLTAYKGWSEITGKYIATVAVAYTGCSSFSRNISRTTKSSTIVNKDLLEDPGLHRTLLGDGIDLLQVPSSRMPEHHVRRIDGCVAITGNASIVTILTTAVMAVIIYSSVRL